ncbi:hypothetical protein GEV39_10725 [Pseudomonas sp. NY5710]|uniref:hypothetical protein n=1 Tax=Pseudomonas sp. NY5710 TaxID=2662033 RepID=UPI001570E6EF|nr:hypothetical protein [Pseudomonas sp. NY5710]QKL01848.1 hypothetical protein GEV39_10725 [Pseudomonas sp. NY5710]
MTADDLASVIEQQHAPDLYSYVLVDPLAPEDKGDSALLAQLREALGESAMMRVPRFDLAHVPHLHPVLVCLAIPGALPSRAILELTARAAVRGLFQPRRYLCGWVFSEQPAANIAAHLSRLCRLPDTAQALSFYPVYEPIRLELLAATFKQGERAPWWPISRWLFLNSSGQLLNLKGQSGQRCLLPASAWRMQADGALVERVLRSLSALRAGVNNTLQCQIPSFAAVRAGNHIQEARALGLTDPEDIVVLALHQLCIHPQLTSLAAVRGLIDAARQEQRALAPLLARYSEAHWRHLTQSLTEAERLA